MSDGGRNFIKDMWKTSLYSFPSSNGLDGRFSKIRNISLMIKTFPSFILTENDTTKAMRRLLNLDTLRE